jgi:AmmeMemoRadiSam system protein A
LNEKLKANRATFVTLTIDGQLRGCIGSLMPVEPLYLDVIHRAAAAALDDPRFKPVQEDELKKINVEVSVLSVPRQLMFKSPQDLLDKLKPGVHGVILVVRNRQATYLPQVWEQIPDKEEFLGQLSKKAGLSETSWKDPDAVVFVYHDEAFKEREKDK